MAVLASATNGKIDREFVSPATSSNRIIGYEITVNKHADSIEAIQNLELVIAENAFINLYSIRIFS